MNRRTFLRSAGAAIASGTIAPALLPAAMLDAPAPAYQAAALGENVAPNASFISAVIFDERYRDCRLFADALVARGAVAFATRSDSAALWYGPLRAHLAQYKAVVGDFARHEPLRADFVGDKTAAAHLGSNATRDAGIIAGFTTEADRHVSQVCGRELALALLYEGAHDSRGLAAGHAPDRVTKVAHRCRAVSGEAEIAATLVGSRDSGLLQSLSRDSSPSPSRIYLDMPSSPSWPAALADALSRVQPGHAAPSRARSHIVPGASAFAPVSALTPRSPDFPGYLTSWLLGPAA
jgi:hypothetical protein